MTLLGRLVGLCFLASCFLLGQTNVVTQHNDLARTGQNLTETILTPASVGAVSFGKIFSLQVDGVVEAQPLYISGLTIGGAKHNVVFIATEHDSLFAFDADTGGTALWQASLLDTAHGAASGATSNPDSASGCYLVNSEYGISGTPVIDMSTGTIYVVSVTSENGYPVDRLHALDITTGAEKFGGPVVITSSMAGTGAGSSNGMLTFDPNLENQRAGLALVNGTIYVAFAAYCDIGNYHGWLFAYNASTLAQTATLLTSPNGVDSGVWMGGAAPAFDSQNGAARMFITTGNGTYDAVTPYATNSVDYADDILRLDLTSGLNVSDAFTALNQDYLSSTDTDLGSSGTLILPDQTGANPHLLVEASKGGTIYLVNRDSLGGYSPVANTIVQELDGQVGSSFGLPAYWNGNLYLWASADHLKQFSLSNGVLSASAVAVSSQIQAAGLGSTPSISANGTTGAIVWSLDTSQPTEILYAHDATNVANTLWSSAANSTRDGGGASVKFSAPTIANGKVYIASVKEVLAYGLLDFGLSAAASSTTVTAGQTATNTVTVTPFYGSTAAITFSASNLPAGLTASFATTGTKAAITFSASSSIAAGSYSTSITGVSGTLSYSVPLVVVVVPAPDFTLTASPTSLSVPAGTSSTTQVTVNPNQTFTGQVAFTCSVATSLANVTCSVPGTVSVTGAVTLTVTAASNAKVFPSFFHGDRWLWLAASLLLALTLANRRKTWLIPAAYSLVFILSLSGCRGGGSSTAATTSTFNETGQITVTATSGSLSHAATVSVTVR